MIIRNLVFLAKIQPLKKKSRQMLIFNSPQDIIAHIGQEIGPSPWMIIDQKMVDQFAKLTGDQQWIHVDQSRSESESPYGKTIVHGFLLLSLTSKFIDTLVRSEKLRVINCGLDRVRFYSAAPTNSRIRMKMTYLSALPIDDKLRMTTKVVFESEGQSAPAMEAKLVYLLYFNGDRAND